MQIDYSATPFYGSGANREYFPHIVYDFELVQAMREPLVKQLFLEERQSIAGERLDDLTRTEEGCIILLPSVCPKTTEPIHLFLGIWEISPERIGQSRQ